MSVLDNRLKYQLRSAEGNPGRRTPGPSLFLVTGVLVLSLAAAVKLAPLQLARATAPSPAPMTDATPVDTTPPRAGLNATMALALDAVAQRYRVAPEALQPIFLAAQEAAKDLDPLLVIAVIGIESGFNPFAQSIMGAQGLMQVIPRYHREKLPPEAGSTAFLDPVNNVRVGTQVLKDAIRRQGGVVEGLQYYAGAVDDPDRGYAARVLAEKQRLEQATRARKSPAAVGSSQARQVPPPVKEPLSIAE
jgi:soluble lytic murein transglycosylase-like protein